MIYEFLNKPEQWKENPNYMSKKILSDTESTNQNDDDTDFFCSRITEKYYINLNYLRKEGDSDEIVRLYEDSCFLNQGDRHKCSFIQIYTNNKFLFIHILGKQKYEKYRYEYMRSFFSDLEDLVSNIRVIPVPKTAEEMVSLYSAYFGDFDDYSTRYAAEFFKKLASGDKKLANDSFMLFVSKFLPY